MAEYVLYGFAQSGNAYKVALMLELAAADWEARYVDYFGGETRTAAYRAINVMGEVPVLAHNEHRLSQSGVILDYLAAQLGKFGPNNDDERRETLRWLLFDNHKFTSYLATYRFMHTFAKNGDTAVMDFFRARIKNSLGIVEKHLERQPFIVGDAPTIADISICGYLYYPAEEFGFDIAAAHPAIAAWLGRIKALPGWKHPYKLMPGHPLPA